MALKLSAEQKSVLKIFGTGMKYLVPNYQRPYSWSVDNCLELWEDLINSYEENSSRSGYFLGNIVLAKSSETDYFEVVDGQQRLITLSLFVKALHLYDTDNNALREILWIPARRSTESEQQRLESAVFEDKDNDNFLECLNVNSKDSIDKKRSKFHQNLDFFCEKIEDKFNKDKDSISKFADFLLDDVYLLPIQSDDKEQDRARDDALTIFETINNRGLDLSDADIFKAQIYMSASGISKQEDFISQWNALVERVQTIGHKVDDAFRVYMHIIRGQNKDTDSEMGLRQFFTAGNKYNKALKKQEYINIMDDLEKVVFCLEYYHRLVKCECENDLEMNLAKWFQIIHEYSNNFPRYATYVYLFRYGVIENGQFNFPKEKINDFIEQSKNVVRYVYNMGATSYVKTKIFEIIKNIFLDEPYVCQLANKDNTYRHFGSIKKGFMLIYIYQNDEQNPIKEYQFDRVLKRNTLNSKDFDYDSLGNYLLVDSHSYYYRNATLDTRKTHFCKSDIIDLKNVGEKLNEWGDESQEERKKQIQNTLLNFFNVNQTEL